MAQKQAPKVIRPFRVVVFQAGESLCAQILEYDMAAEAKTQDGLYVALERVVVAHIVARLENGQEPFAGVPAAPERFWKMFERSKIKLPIRKFRLDVKKPALRMPQPPELRVAATA